MFYYSPQPDGIPSVLSKYQLVLLPFCKKFELPQQLKVILRSLVAYKLKNTSTKIATFCLPFVCFY